MKEKNELEIIKSRLQKAYSMTIKEQKKWSKKIKELEVLSVKLEKSTGKHFLDEEGVKLLISANKEISRELSEERWGDGIGKYFEENPEVNELLDKACSDIDYAFRKGALLF
ncbi:hypothetical protein [Clostridium sp.]|uniref:hypothetical protein n=1 Tax=Clostridium sp. TaxID=1506 RepID=UPI002FDDFC71